MCSSKDKEMLLFANKARNCPTSLKLGASMASELIYSNIYGTLNDNAGPLDKSDTSNLGQGEDGRKGRKSSLLKVLESDYALEY